VVVLAQPGRVNRGAEALGELGCFLLISEPDEAQPDEPRGVDPGGSAPVAPDTQRAPIARREPPLRSRQGSGVPGARGRAGPRPRLAARPPRAGWGGRRGPPRLSGRSPPPPYA